MTELTGPLHERGLRNYPSIFRSMAIGSKGGVAPPSKTGGKRPAWDVKGRDRLTFLSAFDGTR